MTPITSIKTVLAHRGRILLFTPNAQCALPIEQAAERFGATVVHTRGWADPYGPVSTWVRIAENAEFGLFSATAQRYAEGYKIPCTDIVWVGHTGNPVHEAHAWRVFSLAMSRGIDNATPPRLWLMSEGG